MGWAPDIIHCQGWMTSLIPMYLKTIYKDEPVFKNTKIVFSVYCDEDKINLGDDFARKASLNSLDDDCMKCFGDASVDAMNIGAVKHSDAIVTNSEEAHRVVEAHLLDKIVMRHSDEDAATQYGTLYERLLS